MKKLLLSLLLVLCVPGAALAQSAGAMVQSVSVTPTVTAAATNYTTGDCVGGVLTFTGILNSVKRSGMISTVIVTDIGAAQQALELRLFSKSPTAAGDNASCVIADADLPYEVAPPIPLNQFFVNPDNGEVIASPNVWATSSDGNLYGLLTLRGAGAFLYASTSALTVKLVVIQD